MLNSKLKYTRVFESCISYKEDLSEDQLLENKILCRKCALELKEKWIL